MAIDPSAKYPGQIDTSDPTGYPRGKARNVSSPGDGTGTPWEKDLVNDIFGFQQDLLDRASASPSGTPEKVGASQYADAIKTVFADPLENLIKAASDLSPKIPRKEVIAGNKFQLIGAGGGTNGPDWQSTNGNGVADSQVDFALAHLDLREFLPHGAVLTRVKALVNPGAARATAGNRISLQLRTRTLDFVTPAAPGSSAAFTLVRDDGTTNLQVIDSGAFTLTISSLDTNEITVTAGSDGGAHNSDLFYGIELSFDDPGPRNF